MADISMRELLESGVHFGHQKRYWNPKMAEYIFGSRNGIHIINLEKTLPLLKEAVDFLARTSINGKVLFVGTKRPAQRVIREQAERCEMPYVDHRWLGGMLTNYKTVRQSIKRLRELEKMQKDGTFDKLLKKEVLSITRDMAKLERNFGGIKNMGGLPDAIFVIDTGYENIAIQEARRLKIPVIGVVDTNNDPRDIDYIIPGNDDASRAIEFYARVVADNIIKARRGNVAISGAGESEFVEVDSDNSKHGKAVAGS